MASTMSPQTGQEGGVAGLGGLSKDELRAILYKLKLCRYFDERMEALYRREGSRGPSTQVADRRGRTSAPRTRFEPTTRCSSPTGTSPRS